MRKRTQLNINIDDELLKALKFLAITKNIKLNVLVKEILAEKIGLGNQGESNRDVLIELDEIKKRISKLEQI